jgi:hypothetical protein
VEDGMKTGDRVVISYGEVAVTGVVVICSSNQQSLFVQFDGMLGGHVGAMPLLMDQAGVYRSIINNLAVTVRLLS